MSDEEKEAIEWLENDVKKSKELQDKWHMYMVSNKNEILLNLIKKQDRAIDRMAEDFEQTCKSINEEYAVDEVFLNKDKIKQYFLNKQEEN